eukprot:26718-Rhodomonas_salina.1
MRCAVLTEAAPLSGIAKLRYLTKLIFLDLSQSHITDSGCEVLARVHNPEPRATESEKSVRQLKQERERETTAGLISLERISLRQTAVTLRGVRKLEQLPKLQHVQWDGCEAERT